MLHTASSACTKPNKDQEETTHINKCKACWIIKLYRPRATWLQKGHKALSLILKARCYFSISLLITCQSLSSLPCPPSGLQRAGQLLALLFRRLKLPVRGREMQVSSRGRRSLEQSPATMYPATAPVFPAFPSREKSDTGRTATAEKLIHVFPIFHCLRLEDYDGHQMVYRHKQLQEATGALIYSRDIFRTGMLNLWLAGQIQAVTLCPLPCSASHRSSNLVVGRQWHHFLAVKFLGPWEPQALCTGF